MNRETYVLHTTKRCNLNCTYCYEEDKISTYTQDEIQTVLDNIIKNSPDEFMLEFLGGEPMIAWDHIVFTVEYMKGKGKKVDFTITTNGTIIDDEKIDFIKKNNITWAVSVDGFGMANIFRPYKDGQPSFNNIMHNMDYAKKRGLEGIVHIVSHPYNVGWLYDSVVDFYDRGVRTIAAGIIESVLRIDDEFCDEYAVQMRRISDDIRAGKLKGLYIVELESIKPEDDVRTYTRDDSGKVIFETYGRADGDVTSENIYNVQRCEGEDEITTRIKRLRKYVYDYHHRGG
jgi:sulfatase maturation enzyme AslB (radical SAM superfamily)